MSAVCPNGHTSEAEDYCDTCGSPIVASAEPTPPGTAAGASATPSSAGSSLDLSPSVAPAEPGGSGASGGPESVGSPGAPGAPAVLECPNCATENPDGALFCEACGYDFTTGAMPRDPAAGPSDLADTEPDAEAVPPVGAGGVGAAPTAGAPAAGASDSSEAPESFDWLAEVWVDPDWYQTQEAEDPCPSPGLPTIMPLRHRSVLLGRVSTSRNTRPEIDLSSDPGVSRRHAQLTTDGTRWFVEDLGSSNGTFVGPAAGPLPATSIAVGPKTELSDDDRLYVGAWTRVVVRRATPDEVEAYA
ncbi:FHA domain-containing protein [Terrabacter sp. 2YAF2]|uniref:FHA domain-containing protein n=1 Tax=Terrabacter sp. 2YAF2 TaxID=3233026 RepID=UPI003F973E74